MSVRYVGSRLVLNQPLLGITESTQVRNLMNVKIVEKPLAVVPTLLSIEEFTLVGRTAHGLSPSTQTITVHMVISVWCDFHRMFFQLPCHGTTQLLCRIRSYHLIILQHKRTKASIGS